MKAITMVSAVAINLTGAAAITLAEEHHVDIAPFLINGQLLTGGRDHAGNSYAPSLRVYGYEFGEDPFDPYNPTDPGVNQAGGVGGLPAGAMLRYNILSSLRYWDGTGSLSLGDAPDGIRLTLMVGAASRSLTGDSGSQPGSLIQSIAADGSVHKHFVTSLFGAAEAGNIPGEPDFVEPPAGIYAYSLELTLAHDGNNYVSDPLWVVFNCGLDEAQHEAALDYVAAAVVPEPASLCLISLGTGALLLRRRRSRK